MTAETRAFGARLAMARHAAGLTQAELGVKLGRTRSTITNLEAGRCSTTLEQVNAMCRGPRRHRRVANDRHDHESADRDRIHAPGDPQRLATHPRRQPWVRPSHHNRKRVKK